MDSIQEARYDRAFDAYADSEGYMTLESFTAHTTALATMRRQTPDTPAIAALFDELRATWEQMAAAFDVDNDGRISRDEWHTIAGSITEMLRNATDAGAPWPFEPWVKVLYGVIDADGDGYITQEEYTDWLAVLGLAADTDIDAAFAGFDKNKDGHLSWEEFVECSRQFWMTFDTTVPGHRWIGP
jgi:Ca2+-binding EF-hand superfamily protein